MTQLAEPTASVKIVMVRIIVTVMVIMVRIKIRTNIRTNRDPLLLLRPEVEGDVSMCNID